MSVQTLLYGRDPEQRIVGLHRSGDEMTVYTRGEDGIVERREEPFRPFLFASDKAHRALSKALGSSADSYPLKGDLHYRHLWVFDTWREHWQAVDLVREAFGGGPVTGSNSRTPIGTEQGVVKVAADDHTEAYVIPSAATQYLMQTGKTLFKGMTMDDAHRMQVDIEVYSEHGFPNSQREEDRIFTVSMCDNAGWARVLCSRPPRRSADWTPPSLQGATVLVFEDEPSLLEGFLREIHRRDPDVLELHNGFGFDLPYLRDRFKRYRIPFAIGRNKREPRTWTATKKFAERDFEYEAFHVPGRAVVDTMFLAVDYDVIKRDLPSLGLKEVARHFGVAPEGRVYVPGGEIARTWVEDPERLISYALHDVIETRGVAERLLGSTFYLTQMLPMELQRAHTAGTAGSIETLFVRQYLTSMHSLPKAEEGKQEHGGLTDVFHQGVFGPIVYADVDSLYPSIMLNFDVRPEQDRLGLFPTILSELTKLRLETKAKMKAEEDPAKKAVLDAMQGAYKLIINSFYGMLGHGRYSLFCDISEADRVATTGQAILTRMMQVVAEMGGTVIECDTDGVLFVPPEHTHGDLDAQAALVPQISARMPKGITVGMDGLFESMLSYRKKNYVLRDYEGKLKIKGGGFKSRGIEAFGRAYVREQLEHLLARDVRALYDTHERYKAVIVGRQWPNPPDDFCIRVGLKTGVAEYDGELDANENKNRQAQYEVARRIAERTGRAAQAGDVISYYVAGSKKKSHVRAFRDARPAEDWVPGDENTVHYLARLNALAKKFAPFFTKEHFGMVFDPTPVDPKQTDMFGPREPRLDGIEPKNTRLKPNVTFPTP